MRAVVFIKQVPDLRAAPVGLRADGTIARDTAPAVTNPADLHALEAALRLADEVWVLSMGPPAAEEALRDAVARGAARAVLLCDRALAGSDTWATANALAAAVEHLGGADLVLCGMTALDGETGQVGPQVAARLGLPQASGCDDLGVEDGRLVARRIVEGGYERLSLPLPALATVAETGFVPRYPTLPGRRRAARCDVERLTIGEIGLAPDRVGLDASPTKVAHMEPVALPARKCVLVDDGGALEELARALDALLAGAPEATASPDVAATTATPTPTHPDAVPPQPLGAHPDATIAGEGNVWVVCEADHEGLAPVSAELLSRAVELAPELGGQAVALVAAADPAPMAREAERFGAGVVLTAAHPELSPYRCLPHARVAADAIRRYGPGAVLLGATTTGRDLAPRVAALLDAGLAADCTDLTVGPWTRRHQTYDHLLQMHRPAMAGGVMATCVAPLRRPQMATVRPGVFTPLPRPTRAEVVELSVTFEDSDLSTLVLERQVRRGASALSDAQVVVAGGAGCDAESWHLVEELAAAIGGTVAASRAAVEAGLAPRTRQVGQTGTTVRPALYVACGISGALQHVVGMRSATTIVAVNRDPDALIFRLADYGIVGEVADVLPRLTAAFRKAAT